MTCVTVIVLAVLGGCATAASRVMIIDCEVRLRTDVGSLCGRIREAENGTKYASFRGVPYGKPPVGHRRFKELEPLEPWDGFLDAREEGPACPQKDVLYGHIPLQSKGSSEDCIYLNLHVPHEAFVGSNEVVEGRGLSILVMVHAGGFFCGSGLTDLYGPEYLMAKGVIVITFNYRLNVFGFLSLGTKEIPGNQGLRDMVTLLRWVQRNTRAFGGDPNNVTLMGQSAGSTSVHLLSLSKAAEGLFHKIVMMSGTAVPNFFSASSKFAQKIADMFLSELNINKTDSEEIYQELIDKPIVDMMYANSVVQYKLGLASFVPVIESHYPGVTRILDQDPLDLIAQGRGTQYPMLISYVNKEAELFRWYTMSLDQVRRVKEDPKLLLPIRFLYNLPEVEQQVLADKYFRKCFKSGVNQDNYLICLGYTFFKHPTLKVAEWRTYCEAETYMYRFTYNSARSVLKEALWTPYKGAAHAEDLTYVFRVNSLLGNQPSFPPKNNDDRMKDWMTTFVTNFMRCSNPTCGLAESRWPSLSRGYIKYQNIGKPMVYQMMSPTADEINMLDFYDNLDEEISNPTCQILFKAKWPRLSTDNFVYQNIVTPMVYQVKEPTEDQKEMVKFYDSVDIKSRNVTERLKDLVLNRN